MNIETRAAPPLASSRTAAETLAEFAVGLRFEDVPSNVMVRARHCLTDAVACAVFGSTLPWSRMLADYVDGLGATGPCRLPEALPKGLPPAPAALCLGAFSHAFELDSLRKPGAGVHPGATVALPALAMAMATSASGRDLLATIVAGCEVMFRIGNATLHTPELVGFHAPGITGPFGAATVAGRLLGLSAEEMARAFGLCGSLTSGLLAFAKSSQGGMVKRLHLGRAAEGGVMAAHLARRGFDAPLSILEGRFGILDAFCEETAPEQLTRELGTRWESTLICIKRYACHATAQVPVQLLRDLMEAHGFGGGDIAGIDLTASAKVLSHHGERRPTDIMLAQYSVPFSLAIAAYRDPERPSSFSDDALHDAAILDLAGRIELRPGGAKGWGGALGVRLKDGRVLEAAGDSFIGCPETPAGEADIERKFNLLTGAADAAAMHRLLDRLRGVESLSDCTVIAGD
jgi:2-methylcitrate dehydratase PrpD